MSEYLDTSIVVKWFKEEESNHFEALLLLDRIKDFETDFVMSEYGLLELVRALSKAKYPPFVYHRVSDRLLHACVSRILLVKHGK